MPNRGDLPTTLLLNLLEQTGQLSQQINIVQANTAILLEDRGRAAESRRILHEKLDAQGNRLTSCEERIDGIVPIVKQLELTVVRLDAVGNVKVGEQLFKKRFFTRGSAFWAFFVTTGGGASIWHEWDRFHLWLFRWFK